MSTPWLIGLLVLAAEVVGGLAAFAWLMIAIRREPEQDGWAEVAAILADGSHDVLPEVDDWWREVAYDYLEQMWALPARERAS